MAYQTHVLDITTDPDNGGDRLIFCSPFCYSGYLSDHAIGLAPGDRRPS